MPDPNRVLVLQWYSWEYLLRTRTLSLRQKGALLEKIDAAAMREDFSFLRQFSWIGRIFWRSTGPRKSISRKDRVFVLSAGRCAFCGSTERLTVDHIRPVAKGGKNHRRNYQCLCWPCNLRKRDKWEGV